MYWISGESKQKNPKVTRSWTSFNASSDKSWDANKKAQPELTRNALISNLDCRKCSESRKKGLWGQNSSHKPDDVKLCSCTNLESRYKRERSVCPSVITKAILSHKQWDPFQRRLWIVIQHAAPLLANVESM